ncbi:MAG: hypothetical protein KIT80_04855 [Chitinophagaceae bacterium]|nr:hypothetical protein [Chitinophagaceae bacterium]MCW5926222.1 hypothetical protein [Chitinophagaceae bacterium]
MRITLLLFICLTQMLCSYSQQFGGIPSSLKWQQINLPQARIIFPKGLEQEAAGTADVIRYADSSTAATIGAAKRKINIVLQNQTTVANGYVGLAPWRSEFFLTPQFNSYQLGSLPWVQSLALHEYRHVQQYMNFRKGLSKVAYYLLGEEGQALANNAAIPDWFFEGDAVFQETALSDQGRGRVPAFFNDYRALWEGNKKYSFMQLRNGSLKNFIPDHYALGYLLTGYGREKYGPDFWAEVTDDAARFRGVFYPFQKAVKRHGGIRYKTFVKNAFDYYREHPGTRTENQEGETGTFITPLKKKYVTDYTLPHSVGNDSVLVLKRTYRNIAAWYWLVNGKEYRIRAKDIALDDYYSYASGKIVYTAYEPDVRWNQRNYSVIRVLDVHTKEENTITRKSKYFSPDISADGKRVAAVQYLPDQSTALHILDATDGRLLQQVPSSNPGMVFTYPKFYRDNNLVACLRNREGQMCVAIIDIQTGLFHNLTSWSYEIKAYPMVKGDTVYYSASSGYFDDIYAIDITSGNRFRLTSESMSAYQPTVSDNGKLLWSSFSSNGYRLKQKQLMPDKWEPLMSLAVIQSPDLYLPQALQQDGGDALHKLSPGNYDIKRYRKITAPFNFHSWRPYYEQPDWSLTVYGQNILNNFQSSLYYSFNENEYSHTTGFSGLLGAWYPWVTGGVSYAVDRNAVSNNRHIYWNELNANLGLQLPLNFTRGLWHKNLTLTSTVHTLQQSVTGVYKDSIRSNPFQYIQASASWNSQVQTARQHIYPRLAQSFLVRYRQSISEYTASQLLVSGSLYLPGITRTHNLVLSGAYQQRDTANQYRYTNSFPFARGYGGNVESHQMGKWAVNYHFPLFYPDWGFGNLVYFMRIRGNLFFDYAYVRDPVFHDLNSFRSMGGELFFDTKWWNQQPASFGIRYSYLPDYSKAGLGAPHSIEFVLPVNLITP